MQKVSLKLARWFIAKYLPRYQVKRKSYKLRKRETTVTMNTDGKVEKA